MSLNDDIYYCRPRKLDDEALEKTIINSYDTEIKRRKRTVDDDYRDAPYLSKLRGKGEFMYADLSIHDLFQKQFADKYGEFIPMDCGWQCPHCGMKYLQALPPLECNVCHTKSPLGMYVEDGYVRR